MRSKLRQTKLAHYQELAELDSGHVAFRDENIVLYGFRDDAVVAKYGGGNPRATTIACILLEDVRSRGFGNTAYRAISRFVDRNQTFWIHLDLDALDDAVISAVDYRIPGGLSPGEVVALARRALATNLVAGLNVTILNPALDWDGAQTKMVVDMMRAMFA